MPPYSTIKFESFSPTRVVGIGFYDGVTEEFFPFDRETENDDLVWRFLCFLKDRYRKVESTHIYAHQGSDRELRFVLNSILKHEERTWGMAGEITVSWNIRPDLKDPFKIFFHDASTLSSWSTATLLSKSGCPAIEEGSNVIAGVFRSPIGLPYSRHFRDDCIAVSQALTSLDEGTMVLCPDVVPQQTTAKYGEKVASIFYDLRQINDNREFDRFIRSASYGGRNEVYKRYGENVRNYDTYMQYVSCCHDPLPVGKMEWVASQSMSIERGGLVEATVKVPKDLYLGPLPHKRDGHICFPVGEFTDWWHTIELRNADRLGMVEDYTIHRQFEGEEAVVLDKFADAMAYMRKADPQREEWWKSLPNILFGKFLREPIISKTMHIDDLIAKYGDIPDGYTPLDIEELLWSTPIDLRKSKKNLPAWAKPAVGTRIRALGRIKHLDILLQAAKTGDIFYCDTDSVFTTSTLPTSGNTPPGGLQHKGDFERAYFIRQKLYGVISDGRMHQRSSGFSDFRLLEQDFCDLLSGKKVLEQSRSTLSTLNEIIGGDFQEVTTHSTLRGSLPENRIYEELDSRPICLP